MPIFFYTIGGAMDIAQWVKAARTKAGLSQEELGIKLDLTKGNVSA